MSKFPRIALVILAVAVAASRRRRGDECEHQEGTATAEICVLLPDSKSSVRWETQDRPRLAAAFKALGDSYSIVNAEGSASTQLSQAQQCLTNGAKVHPARQPRLGLRRGDREAREGEGVKVDRLRPPDAKGAASYYVSFDNVTVGKLQGQGLINCLKASGHQEKPVIAELNGAPTDNNATLFAQGYNSVLNLYTNGTLEEGPEPVGARSGTTSRP